MRCIIALPTNNAMPFHSARSYSAHACPFHHASSRLGGDLGLSVGDLDTELLGASHDLYTLSRGDSVCDPAKCVSRSPGAKFA